MGGYHAKILRWLGYDVSTCDPDPDKGADFTDVDVGTWRSAAAVAIAVPIQYAAEEAARWHAFNGRLLLEKPVARTHAECVALADELVNVRVGVGYVERFNPVVRALQKAVVGSAVTSATFTRWNPRPSWDVALDLASHDVDLTRWLGLKCEPAYRTWAESSRLVRNVSLTVADAFHGSLTQTFDLTAYEPEDGNPLCAEWHALFTDSPDVATLQDAAAVLAALGR